MSSPPARLVAHVVRSFGGITEPFIQQRVTASTVGFVNQLWTERLETDPEVAVETVRLSIMAPRSLGDRLFHRLPAVGPAVAGPYRSLEQVLCPDVIHAHYASTGFLVGSVTKSPLVVSAYGFDLSTLPRHRGWRLAYARLRDRVGMLLVEGPAMRERAQELGFDSARISIVRIGAALEQILYRPRNPDGADPLRLLCSGRMVPKKGHRFAIEAMAASRSMLPSGSYLTIVGSGPLESELRQLANRLGIDSAVRFLGTIDRSRYLDLVNTSDVVLVPSVTGPDGDTEGGAPTTILDAQASGALVIGSRHADIPFLVEDGATGLLAAEGSTDDLCAQLERALDARSSWPEMAARARQVVVREHSDRTIAASLAAAYRQVLE